MGGNGWNCSKLGNPTRCAADSENCLPFGCCAGVGHQCYKKNKDWGVCMQGCNPPEMKFRENPPQDWSCDMIGPRNTMDPEALESVFLFLLRAFCSVVHPTLSATPGAHCQFLGRIRYTCVMQVGRAATS